MKKLAIVGSHPDTREDAPFDNHDFDIWVFNEAAQNAWCKRWDAVFQLHKPEVYSSPNNMSNKGHWDWLQQDHGSKIIWMQERDDRVPNSQRFPLEELIEHVPGASLKWFDASAAFAMALAIFQGYESIEIYGMDLVSNTEYNYQLRCWNFWVGVAFGCGIDVRLMCEKNDFGTGTLYGYDGETQIDREYFVKRVQELESLWKPADWKLHKIKDKTNDAILVFHPDKLPDLVKEYQALALEAGEISGALAEAQNYAERKGPISRQEFEKRSAAAQRDGENLRVLMYHAGGQFEYVYNVWRQTRSQEALNQLRFFLGDEMQKAFDTGGRLGIHRENLHYMMEVDRRVTAAGGGKTLAALGWKEAA